jgi:broad specificity phosphatase PhoE
MMNAGELLAKPNPTESVCIFLVRHGETDWNKHHRFQGRTDIPLNSIGKAQAKAVALALKGVPLTVIYSSPLKRAIETARTIKAYHPTTPIVEEFGLIEMDLGEFDGMEAQHWAEKYPDLLEIWKEKPSLMKMPGGESLKEVQIRAVGTLESIYGRHKTGSHLLFASHNFVITALLCHACGKSLDQFRELRQETASLNILYKQGERLWAESVNDRSHLDKYMP